MLDRRSYCSACGENFARKFKFCPICGVTLKAPESSTAFHVTIVAEKNARQRNLLLLLAMVGLTSAFAVGTVVSIFNKPLDVEALGGDVLVSYVNATEPLPVEPPDEVKPGEKPGNKPGGGGNNEERPTQKGVAATQTDNPLFAPSKTFAKVTRPDIAIRAAIEGNRQTAPSDDPYGVADGAATDSDGPGCCGGQGEATKGRGGQGNEPGPGIGSDKDGKGGSDDPDAPNIPKPKTAVTTALSIISKPRANYTDAAREKLVQGKVVLRVTFQSNGQIGQVVTVSGLPAGLTEAAIQAARSIRFEPAKSNGTPVSVTRVIEYNFSIF